MSHSEQTDEKQQRGAEGVDTMTGNNKDSSSQTGDEKHASSHKGGEEEDAHELDDLSMDKAEQKRILRKIDWSIVPYCSLLYLLSFLDRVNIGQAAVAGLKQDLRITTGNAYQVALSVFFISYIVFEVPCLLLLRKLKPHRFIPAIMIGWGIVMTLMGLVENGAGLQAARWFLGMFEGGLFPGINFLLTTWYARSEMNLRVGIFFSGATLAGAFGGILGFALKQIPFPSYERFGSFYQGTAAGAAATTIGGWRWIFIIEGILTILCSIPGPWLIVDFPGDKNKILTEQQTKKWNHRLAISQGVTNADVPFSWRQVRNAFTNYRMYLHAIMYISIAMPLYSLALFSPTIIAALGISGASANLLSVPPYVLGFITTMVTAFVSDRYTVRGPFIIFWALVTLIGYIILICNVSPGVKYFAIFLTVSGVSPNIATSISYVGSNFGPIYTRATVMGFYFTIGNSAGLISSNIYPATESPRYIKGHAINLGFAAMTLVVTSLLSFLNIRENRRRDAISYAHPDGSDVDPRKINDEDEKARWGYQEYTKEQLLELGDKHLGFRYVY